MGDKNEPVNPTGADPQQGHADNSLNREMVGWTRAIAIFTLVLAVAATIGIGFNGWQLHIMQGQLDEMREAKERPFLMAYITEHNILRGDADLKNCPPSKEERCFDDASLSLVIENAGRQPAIIKEFAIGMKYEDIGLDSAVKYIKPPSMLLDDDLRHIQIAVSGLNGKCSGLNSVSRIPPNASVTVECRPALLDVYASDIMTNTKSMIVLGAINYSGPASSEWQSGFQFSYVPPEIHSLSTGYFKPNLDQTYTYDVAKGNEPDFSIAN